jgi:hypothetical protein
MVLPRSGRAAGLTTAARSERTRRDARGTPAHARRRLDAAADVRAGTGAHARGKPRCASKRKGETRRQHAEARAGGRATLDRDAHERSLPPPDQRAVEHDGRLRFTASHAQLPPRRPCSTAAFATRTSIDARILGAPFATAAVPASGKEWFSPGAGGRRVSRPQRAASARGVTRAAAVREQAQGRPAASTRRPVRKEERCWIATRTSDRCHWPEHRVGEHDGRLRFTASHAQLPPRRPCSTAAFATRTSIDPRVLGAPFATAEVQRSSVRRSTRSAHSSRRPELSDSDIDEHALGHLEAVFDRDAPSPRRGPDPYRQASTTPTRSAGCPDGMHRMRACRARRGRRNDPPSSDRQP